MTTTPQSPAPKKKGCLGKVLLLLLILVLGGGCLICGGIGSLCYFKPEWLPWSHHTVSSSEATAEDREPIIIPTGPVEPQAAKPGEVVAIPTPAPAPTPTPSPAPTPTPAAPAVTVVPQATPATPIFAPEAAPALAPATPPTVVAPAAPKTLPFPGDIPLPAGAKTVSERLGNIRNTTGQIDLLTADDAATILGFYKKHMPAQGWELSQSLNNGQGITLLFAKGGRSASITIVGTKGAGTSILIVYSAE